MDDLGLDHPAAARQQRVLQPRLHFATHPAVCFARSAGGTTKNSPEVSLPELGVVEQRLGLEVVAERMQRDHAGHRRAHT